MGVSAKAFRDLAPSTRQVYESASRRAATPRVKAAIRLYASGAVKTKRAAAEAVDLAPQYFYLMTSPQVGNEEVRQIQDDVDLAIQDETINISRVLELAGRKAIGTIYSLMRFGKHEHLQLKAAVDLADRSPETSKTLKIQSASITISGSDAKELAESLVMSAKARDKYAEAAEGDFVRVDMDHAIGEADARTHTERAEEAPKGSTAAASTANKDA